MWIVSRTIFCFIPCEKKSGQTSLPLPLHGSLVSAENA